MSKNPFRYHSDPYVRNPFAVLGLEQDAGSTRIRQKGRYVEDCIAQGVAVTPGGGAAAALAKGDGEQAVEWISEPTLRLAFDLMHFGWP
jgi:hypothetical protein